MDLKKYVNFRIVRWFEKSMIIFVKKYATLKNYAELKSVCEFQKVHGYKKLYKNMSEHGSKRVQGRTLSSFGSWGCKLPGFEVEGLNLDFTKSWGTKTILFSNKFSVTFCGGNSWRSFCFFPQKMFCLFPYKLVDSICMRRRTYRYFFLNYLVVWKKISL